MLFVFLWLASLQALPFQLPVAIVIGMKNTSRSIYLVCYDVSSPRRLNRVRKFLTAFRVGGQKSFFECWMTPAELREVEQGLKALIDPETDRAHLFQLDPRMKPEFLGCARPSVTDVFMIV